MTPILSSIPHAPEKLEEQIVTRRNINIRRFKNKRSITVKLPDSKKLHIEVAGNEEQRNCLLAVMFEQLTNEQWTQNGRNFPLNEGNTFEREVLTLQNLRGLNAKYLSAAFDMQNIHSNGKWKVYLSFFRQRLSDEYAMVRGDSDGFDVANLHAEKKAFLSNIQTKLYYAEVESVKAMADLFLINILVIDAIRGVQLIQPNKYSENLPEITSTLCLFHRSIMQGNEVLHYYDIVIDMKIREPKS